MQSRTIYMMIDDAYIRLAIWFYMVLYIVLYMVLPVAVCAVAEAKLHLSGVELLGSLHKLSP